MRRRGVRGGASRSLSGVIGALCALTLFFIPSPPAQAASPEGRLVHLEFWSPTLNQEVGVRVYLPPGYDVEEAREERYPVVYLLHGLSGSSWDWLQIGQINRVLDKRARGRNPRKVIAVSPNGGSSYWTQQLDRVAAPGQNYGRFVGVDLVAEIDRRFRTLRRRRHRALVGISMGGFGALSVGMLYPDRFGAAVSLSGALFTKVPDNKKAYRRVWGDPPVAAHFDRFSPYALASSLPRSHPWPRIYIACGDGDHKTVRARSLAMHERLDQVGIPHVYSTGPGRHDWRYWIGSAPAWLDFLDAGFSYP